jgi:hypothetical protein
LITYTDCDIILSMNNQELNRLIEFLKLFDDKAIEVGQLANQLNIENQILLDFLSDYKNYKDIKVFEYFYIKRKYYVDGVEDDSTHSHLNKQAISVAIRFVNRYFVEDSRKADLMFYKLKGLNYVKGSVDNSDIGGLYTSAYVDSLSSYSEVPVLDNLEEVFDFLQKDIKVEYDYVNKFFTSSVNDCIVYSSELKVCLVKLLSNFLKNRTYYLVQLEEVDEEGVLHFVKTMSNVFYTEEEAKLWKIKQNFETSDFVSYKILTIKGE